MSSASPAEVRLARGSLLAERAAPPEIAALGDAIVTLAARLHAATYELLVLLREFDARDGWNAGFLSCAHWLHWRTGIDLGAAREKVRVAKALATLPRVSAAMQRGQLSYAKVRAITRVATPDSEGALLDVAMAGNCAHVERLVRAWRRVDRAAEARDVETRHWNRQLSTWVDDDGMVVIRGRLTPEVGAVVQRALEAAADRLFREAAGAPAGGAIAAELTPGQRRADALGLLAESALAADLDGGTAGDRYQVVLHVNAELPTAPPAPAEPVDANPEPFDGALEVDHGALYVSMETSRRLSCDASVVAMHHDPDGSVRDVNRKTRSIPTAIRRAVTARDRQCRFPGCTSRRCDAHHVEHWADGGRTSADNLVLLCRRHHRAVHEGGFGIGTEPGRRSDVQPTRWQVAGSLARTAASARGAARRCGGGAGVDPGVGRHPVRRRVGDRRALPPAIGLGTDRRLSVTALVNGGPDSWATAPPRRASSSPSPTSRTSRCLR